MKRLLLCFLVLLAIFPSACSNLQTTKAGKEPLLILVSIDAFRWDYLDIHSAPTLSALAREGTHALRMNSSFPSKTFPNHYTLVTGLRPESHGMVANTFHDPESGDNFTMARMETKWWDQGEPIWITAEKQQVRSACFFWPGSQTELQGLRPSLWKLFDKKLNSADRVDGLLAWLDLPEEKRPRFCTLYFDIVDTIGHEFGPRSLETAAAVLEVDKAIQRLLDGLRARGLQESNLIIVSDHGMSETGPETTVYIDQLIDLKRIEVETSGPVAGLRPKPGQGSVAEIVAAMRAKAPKQIQVFAREDVPAEYHYSKSRRISPIVLIGDEHWVIEKRPTKGGKTYANKASHGWDPRIESMGALFIAKGPSFRRAHSFPVTENVNLYRLLCDTLHLRPAPNEGDDSLSREALVPGK